MLCIHKCITVGSGLKVLRNKRKDIQVIGSRYQIKVGVYILYGMD